MSQNIVSDALNKIMNAKKARKTTVEINYHSKLLSSILAIAKLKGYIKSYKIDGKKMAVEIDKLNYCKAITPRYAVKVDEIEKYEKRYLPAKNFGVIIVSTSKGLMSHQSAQEKKIGGSLVAYFY
ncbi:30S ribosomal protein S8 [Candidatus Pacearchaeota archaeon]|nr:30S ribosomal protein S8 [Candidatus Pacearchaeota archaeon]